ncbi:MAG: zinc ribbon domain-containing protein [Pirellulales bacterium]|nr:zinc ribbon domain-containing protein [Pirellulales bacterium]
MPIFEYLCKECGHVTEFLEKADAKGKHECGQCGSAKTEKIFSGFATKEGESSSSSRSSCPTGTCPLS